MTTLAFIYDLLSIDISYIKNENQKFYQALNKLDVKHFQTIKDTSIMVSLNHSLKSDLMKLPHIGNKTSDKIIEYRIKHQFKHIEELKKIKGIGKKRFKKIKKYLTL